MKRLVTLFTIIIIFATAGGLLGTRAVELLPEQPRNEVNTKAASKYPITPSVSTDTQEVGVPSTIRIPKIRVNAPVEQVGLDSEKRMDVPKNVFNTGWYMLGPRPGESGNAVIDGHLDTPSGQPSVFSNLTELSSGDTIEIIDEFNNTYTFAVTGIETYQADQVPLKKIFSKDGKPQLNLITCGGVFDSSSRDYSERTVVYSQLISQHLSN